MLWADYCLTTISPDSRKTENLILSGMRPWRSWIARQTPTFLTDPAEIRRKALETGQLTEWQRKKRCWLTTVSLLFSRIAGTPKTTYC